MSTVPRRRADRQDRPAEPLPALIVKRKVADFGDDVEDLGRVSRALVRALDLAPGNFIRIDHRYKVSA
jgi:hypothetical protein